MTLVVALLLACAACTEFPTGGGGDDDTGSDGGDDDTTVDDPCGDPVGPQAGTPDDGCTSTEPYEQFEPLMETLWQWTAPVDEPEHFQVLSPPVVIDLNDDDGDGHIGPGDVPDVVFIGMADESWHSDGLLRVVSGIDGSELWYDTTLRELPSGFGSAAGELVASSPGPEIVTMDVDNNILCYSAGGQLLWETQANETFQSGTIALHDMDHDGEPEVIYGRVILGADGTYHGKGEHGFGRIHGGYPCSYAVDLDGDGALEVVVGDAAYRKDGSALWSNDLGDGTTAVGDFDLDGDPEIVVSGGGELRLQDHQGQLIWGPVATLGETANGAPPTVADFNGDGYPEIGIADKHYYQVYDGHGGLLWSQETTEESSGFTGSTVFDFNGDGTAEVVYADEADLFIFEGPTGTILFQEPRHSSRTNVEYPVIVDVNADGAADIVLASNSVFEVGDWDAVTALTGINETGWWATRRIWNQHAYFVTNVNDDGTIPQVQQDPWEVHNSFRQARPETGWDGYPVADLEPVLVGICDAACPDQLSLAFRVRNRGAEPVTAGLPVTLWSADGHLIGVVYVPDALDPGWTSGTLEIPFDPQLVGGADMRLHVDYLSTGEDLYVECDEDNNLVSIPGATCD